MTYRKKLIEVALPLDAINKEAAREKSIRHGHPSTLHLWWARRPLAACRAVLFAQMVDDPSEYMPDEESANEERDRLFHLIEELVKWENINNEELLDKARLEIARSVARGLGEPVPIGKAAIREFLVTKAPPVLDPFAGGGSIPLEAQRLGLRAYASDLNPVAVLINKALIEIPPKFADMPPIHPMENEMGQIAYLNKEWKGAEGLAEDIRYYGAIVRKMAWDQIGHLYPDYNGERVLAWIWARTIASPNPAVHTKVPLVRSFDLSRKKRNRHWIEPKYMPETKQIQYKVKSGSVNTTQGTVSRQGGKCFVSDTPIPFEYIRDEAQNGRMGAQLMSIVTEGDRKRNYYSPNKTHIEIAHSAIPDWYPSYEMSTHPQYMAPPRYGMRTFADLYSPRQLLSLEVFSKLIRDDVKKIVDDDYKKADLDTQSINKSNSSISYADAIMLYLAFALDRVAMGGNTLTRWNSVGEKAQHCFGRQALPIVWDYAETNPFTESTGSWFSGVKYVADPLAMGGVNASSIGHVFKSDARDPIEVSNVIVSTDPPYYDNVPYADLSDFFYVWLRRTLSQVFPDQFQTVLVPKIHELVADNQRLGGREKANAYFEEGLRSSFIQIKGVINTQYPLSIYYAFRQIEIDNGLDDGQKEDLPISMRSTGWETMLQGLLDAQFKINGTWPIRTEMKTRLRSFDSNTLASSIVLICRPKTTDALSITRREFVSYLRRELPTSLRQLQLGSIAPVDFAQAAIGPGISIFSRYKQVLDADGSSMSVRSALALINQALDEFLAEQEGEFDTDTRWVLVWYEQYGHSEGPFGVAETLSKAKNTSVDGLVQAGVLEARAGKVKLLHRSQLKEEWDPTQDKRLTVWEATQYLIRALEHGGEKEAAFLLSRMGSKGEAARDLAYRLYTICEHKGWAKDAVDYNMLVVAWPRLKELAHQRLAPTQERLL